MKCCLREGKLSCGLCKFGQNDKSRPISSYFTRRRHVMTQKRPADVFSNLPPSTSMAAIYVLLSEWAEKRLGQLWLDDFRSYLTERLTSVCKGRQCWLSFANSFRCRQEILNVQNFLPTGKVVCDNIVSLFYVTYSAVWFLFDVQCSVKRSVSATAVAKSAR